MNKRIHVIVVTYNGSKWVEKCFGSLTKSDVPLEIYAIDNSSSDNTVQLIREKFPAVHVIETGANLGFGKANNIGMRIAIKENADYVLLVNQDTWLNSNDTIVRLIEASEKHKEYGILSPFHYGADEHQLERQFVEFLSYRYVDMFVSDLYFHKLKDIYPTTYIHAAFWVIPINVLKKVGVFDPIFEHYGEDDDFMERTKHWGYKIGLVSEASITHDGIYKTWEMVEWNKNRNYILALQELKKMRPRFRTNVLTYLKKTFDETTSYLLFRKFKKLRLTASIFYRAMRNIKSIRKSFKASFTEGAFINE